MSLSSDDLINLGTIAITGTIKAGDSKGVDQLFDRLNAEIARVQEAEKAEAEKTAKAAAKTAKKAGTPAVQAAVAAALAQAPGAAVG